jgi:hypothetical protein
MVSGSPALEQHHRHARAGAVNSCLNSTPCLCTPIRPSLALKKSSVCFVNKLLLPNMFHLESNMFNLRTLLLLLLMGLNGNAFAQVYQSTDSEGNTSFSDTPSAGSNEIEVPETNVGDSVKVPEPSAEPEPAPKPEVVEQPAPPPEAVEGDYDNGSGYNRRRHHRRYGHGR